RLLLAQGRRQILEGSRTGERVRIGIVVREDDERSRAIDRCQEARQRTPAGDRHGPPGILWSTAAGCPTAPVGRFYSLRHDIQSEICPRREFPPRPAVPPPGPSAAPASPAAATRPPREPGVQSRPPPPTRDEVSGRLPRPCRLWYRARHADRRPGAV